MKRVWKRNDGVSPVIATILMVAITVVLAAVLYVMVTQFTQGGGGGEPVATFGAAQSVDAWNWKADIAGVSRAENLASYKIIVMRNSVAVAWMNTTSSSTSGILTFSDIDGGGKLSAGDRCLVNCTAGGGAGSWELNLYWVASGAKIGTVTWST